MKLKCRRFKINRHAGSSPRTSSESGHENLPQATGSLGDFMLTQVFKALLDRQKGRFKILSGCVMHVPVCNKGCVGGSGEEWMGQEEG